MRKPGQAWIRALRLALLCWYDERGRDLPWRRNADPYRVWVSEIMLQQTRVEAVIPYYERWLRQFPTLDALASAEPDDVLRAWEGLGYYARARNLHRAARMVRERFAGDVPSEASALRSLPGVGDYTAGAIASIAYGRREAALDGNVRRVLCRLLDVADARPQQLNPVAAALMPSDRPGDFNQALMDLGATVCTPRAPRCDDCPAATLCRARERGTQLLRPRARKRAAVPIYDLAVAVVVSRASDVLLVKRPGRGLLAGLWCFPAQPFEESETSEDAATALVWRLLRDDVARTAPSALGGFTHTFSHRRERYHVFRSDAGRATNRAEGEWIPVRDLSRYALPAAQRSIAHLADLGL